MIDIPRRQALLRRLALLCAVLALIVIASSALLRLHKGGIGCQPWPDCHAQALAAANGPAPTEGVAAARLAHRVAASLALVLVLLMVGATAGQRALRSEMGLSLALLAVVLALAVLGVVTPGSKSLAVALGNLLGGFAILALSTWLALRHGGRTRRPAAAAGVVVLTLAQIGSGAFASTTQSALQPGLAAPLQWHLAAAVLVLAGWLWVAWASRGERGRDAALLVLLLVAQVALGFAAWQLRMPLLLAWLHNAGAALLLVAGLRLVR